MPVPKEIRQVPRPENTVVYSYGKHKDRYAVREMRGTKVCKDGRRRPDYGKVVGHIINKMYIPKKESEIYPDLEEEDDINIKEWGASELCDKIAQPVFLDLCEFFSLKEAVSLYCMAILKVLDPDIEIYELQNAFHESWLSQLYPMATLSQNAIRALLESVGKNSSSIRDFIAKQALNARTIQANNNYLVTGAEFVNLLASSIENRLKNFLAEKGVLKNRKLSFVLHDLTRAKKEKVPGKQDWKLRTMSTKDKTLLQTLGLIPAEPPKKRGRPAGVKNSSAAKAARREAHDEAQQPVKRRRGRPPGAKNKKTLERERLQALLQKENPAFVITPVKRPRGRPKGAKNKKTLERERLQELQQQENPVLTMAEAKVESVTKRKRGRPPGAKNEKTIERERQAALKKAAQEKQVSSDLAVMPS